jgi:hypothetical protein
VTSDKVSDPLSIPKDPAGLAGPGVCWNICIDYVWETKKFNRDRFCRFGFSWATESIFGEELFAAGTDIEVPVLVSCRG